MIENRVEELQPGIFLLRGEGRGSHSYLIRAAYRNVLIDSGLDQNFFALQEQLFSVGLKLRDIDIIINTHEHLDHIGANRYFQEFSLIAAHRFAATKITLQDHYVTLYRSRDLNELAPPRSPVVGESGLIRSGKSYPGSTSHPGTHLRFYMPL